MLQIQIANLSSFLSAVERARLQAADLAEPLTAIGKDWMRANQTFFSGSGSGPWADLSNKGPTTHVRGFGPKKTGEDHGQVGGYKREKLKRWGFIYPILRASGTLERSITIPGDSNSLFEILNKTTLLLGTRVVSKTGANYPFFLAHGTKFMPARNFMVVPELTVARWVKILEDYVTGSWGPPGKAPAVAAAA